MTNLEQQFNQYLDLTTKELDKAISTALNKSANVLKQNTQRNLAEVLPASLTANKYPDALITAVMRSKYDKKKASVKVHIMGNRNKSSGSFRLRFFEGGTNDRFTKKGQKRGRITALNFFSNAIASTNTDSIIEDELNKAIEKINAKK